MKSGTPRVETIFGETWFTMDLHGNQWNFLGTKKLHIQTKQGFCWYNTRTSREYDGLKHLRICLIDSCITLNYRYFLFFSFEMRTPAGKFSLTNRSFLEIFGIRAHFSLR